MAHETIPPQKNLPSIVMATSSVKSVGKDLPRQKNNGGDDFCCKTSGLLVGPSCSNGK